jgi:hypothetical protein
MRAKLGLRIRVKFNFALILCEAHRLVRFTRERGGLSGDLDNPFRFLYVLDADYPSHQIIKCRGQLTPKKSCSSNHKTNNNQ